MYRLSEASLRRGFEAGRTADDIGAFLADHATREVPQSLSYLIADLGRRFGQVRVGSAPCYVRSDDPSLLAEVTRSRRTARLGLRLLAPTVAVAHAEPATVLDALRGAGYLPAPEGDDGGLVLRRPESRRAPPRRPARSGGRVGPVSPESPTGAPGGSNGAAPDPAILTALVERLRKAPAPAPSPPATEVPTRTARPGHDQSQPAQLRPPPVPPPQLGIFDDEDPRPLEIAKGRAEVELLLALAFVEDWAVRLAYTNRKGRSSQINLVVVDDPDDEVLVECLPTGTPRTLLLDRIEWARVMTEAEEELLY